MENLGRSLQNTMKRIAEVRGGLGQPTGNFCNKHSKIEKAGKRTTRYEYVDFNEELGLHEVEMVRAIDGSEMCPVCKKNELEDKLQREIALPEKQKYDVRDTSTWLKSKSIILDDSIKNATFENFEVMDAKTKELKAQSVDIKNKILNGSKETFMFVGLYGRGKSHLSYAILKSLNIESYKNGKPLRCVYIQVNRMMKLIDAIYSMSQKEKETYKYKPNYFVELAEKADVLVVDDLGAELGKVKSDNESTDAKVTLLSDMFEARQGKPTIVTTNLLPKEIESAYSGRVNSRVLENFNGKALIFDESTPDKRTMK